jgi:hypothetical protein
MTNENRVHQIKCVHILQMPAPLLMGRLAMGARGAKMAKMAKGQGRMESLSNMRSQIAAHKRKGSITPILILIGALVVFFAIFFTLMAMGVVSLP